jgi:NADH-quinone oxidoreductase subunit F
VRLTDDQIFARYAQEPAPLLPILHAFHDRDGVLGEETLRTISKRLQHPLADLFGTVTFYHFLRRERPGKDAPRVCDGIICKLHGADQLLAELASEGASPMPCAGRCDAPIPVLRGDRTFAGTSKQTLRAAVSPLPAKNPGGSTECVFAAIRQPGRNTLDGYLGSGGYEGLKRAVEMAPDDLIALIADSKLAGRGGAGFPTGTKWKAVRQAPGEPKTIVANADEGEPGCFKDRALMDYDPHALLEGMAIAAYATGATQGFIYLRYEYPETFALLAGAIADAERKGFLGSNIAGARHTFRVYLRRGAGAYICGEEGSLLNSLEGKHPFPRNRPPFPVTHGYDDKPTAVNNVETLCSVPPIVVHGAEWYRGLGMNGQAGTKLISLSGDIARPGNYEVPLGLPLRTLLHEWAGGPAPGRRIQAVTMAGLSGGFLAGDDLDVTLDEPSIRKKGSFLGAGGIMVFDDTRDMVLVAREAMAFFAHESCGKCFPCRIGTQRLTERLAGEAKHLDLERWRSEVLDLGKVMKATSACGLGIAAPLVTDSLLRYFPEQVAAFVERR